MVDKEKYFNQWKEKLGTSIEDINKEYNKLLSEEKETHKDLDTETQEQRAIQRLAMIYKKQLRSPAEGFEGLIIGASDPINFNAKKIREAKALYNKDQSKAIDEGITDEEGTPLETRETWPDGKPNNAFGKPIPEESWARTIFGVASKTKGDNNPKFFILRMRGDVAKNTTIPIFKPVRFRAIDKSNDSDETITMNSSVFTTFEEDTSLDLPDTKTILNKFCSDLKVKLEDLETYHNEHKDNFNRIAVVEADVSFINLEPTSVGSRRIVIEDAESLDLEATGVTCWVPQTVPIDFAEQSKVIVVGRTAQGFKRDEQGNKTNELGDMMMNVFGLYALPEYKITTNIEPITEDNSNPEPEKSEKPSEPKIDKEQTKISDW